MATLQTLGTSFEQLEASQVIRSAVDPNGNEYLYEVDEAGRASVVWCIANAPVVHMPATLGGHPVTAIGDEAFATSVKLDAGLRPPASRQDARRMLVFAGFGSRRRNGAIERVVVAPGVTSIGRGAFRGCARLVDVALPDALEEIGDYAFSASGIRSISLPARCTRMSDLALRTGPACLPGCNPAYRSKVEFIDVDSANPSFCMRGDVLCRRLAAGGLEAFLCPGKAKAVDLRRDIVSTSPQAFAGTYAIGELKVRESLQAGKLSELLPNRACDRVTIQLDASCGDGREVSVSVPSELFGHPLFAALCRSGRIDVAAFLREYDEAVWGMRDAFGRAKLMLERLASPVCLDVDVARRFDSAVSDSLDNLCAHIGARGMWRHFDLLADTGLLNAGTIGRVIDVLSAVSDSASISYLLQMRRTRFAESAWDYAL